MLTGQKLFVLLVAFGAICLLALTGTAFGWGNASVYAGERASHLEELQDCEKEVQILEQKNWICTNQEKEALLERLREINKASVAAKICATEPPGSETLEEMEARGAVEQQCSAEWMQRVQEVIKNLSNCKSGCGDDSDCTLDEICVEGE